MADQIALVLKSLKDFKNNLILLVPMLLSFGTGILFVILVLLQLLFGALIFRGASIYESLPAGLIVYIAIFAIIDLAICLFMVSYVTAAYYGTATDVVINGKSSFKSLLKHGKEFLKPVLTYFIAKFVVFTAPLLILGPLVFLAFLVSNLAGYVILALSVLLYGAFAIAFSVLTIFTNPILVRRKLGGFSLIAEALKYGKSNFEQVIITVAVTIVLGIISSAFYLVFYIPSFIMRVASESVAGTASAVPLTFGAVAFEILASIVSSICGIIILLYIFNSYFDKNPIKNWKQSS